MLSAAFRHALEVETATLQAQHPILADALGRAHALIVDGLVYPLEDGHTAEIGSSTDATLAYHVNGQCQCRAQAFQDGPCKHRLALRLYQRAGDRLAAEEERFTVELEPAPAPASTEVPAIMSTTLTIEGRQVEVKLCDTDDARLVARLVALLQQFPVPQVVPGTQAEGWCSLHGTQMKWNAGKEGKHGWFSHKAGGDWCKGKEVR